MGWAYSDRATYPILYPFIPINPTIIEIVGISGYEYSYSLVFFRWEGAIAADKKSTKLVAAEVGIPVVMTCSPKCVHAGLESRHILYSRTVHPVRRSGDGHADGRSAFGRGFSFKLPLR